jgi:predicted ArsR family transcriptional regulator
MTQAKVREPTTKVDDFTVVEIVKTLGVSPASVYRHLPPSQA